MNSKLKISERDKLKEEIATLEILIKFNATSEQDMSEVDGMLKVFPQKQQWLVPKRGDKAKLILPKLPSPATDEEIHYGKLIREQMTVGDVYEIKIVKIEKHDHYDELMVVIMSDGFPWRIPLRYFEPVNE